MISWRNCFARSHTCTRQRGQRGVVARLAAPDRSSRAWFAGLTLGAVLGLLGPACEIVFAELPMPRLLALYPSGARQGTAVEVTLEGNELVDVTGLYFSLPGITAERLPGEGNKPRFKISVPADARVGVHDVRVIAKGGITNPRCFVVGDLPEAYEKEPNNERGQANRAEVGSIMSGTAGGGEDVDWFVFGAKKGQRVLIECWAWRIDTRLDGFMFLYDAQGKQLAVSQDDNSRDEKNDPLIDFDVPADGDYFLKLSDFMYNGGAQYGYRLKIGVGPLIDFAIPAGVRLGETTPVTLYGRNLPGGEKCEFAIRGCPLEKLVYSVTVPAEATAHGLLEASEVVRPPASLLNALELRLPSEAGISNARRLTISSVSEGVEQEPNNSSETAQRLVPPVAITGQCNPVKDVDYFVFSAKKNEPIEISVQAQRFGSPVDPDMEILKPKGDMQSSPNDDGENIGQIRFTTSSRDIRYEFKPPEDGDYKLRVEHLYGQAQGGPQFVYRLELTPPMPDFQLVCQPTHETRQDSHVVLRGGRERLDVFAWRLSGHDAPITISARKLPPGVTATPVTLWPKGKWATLVLEAAPDAPIGESEIEIVGVSDFGSGPVERVARGGVVVMETTNTPAISRVTRSILLAVRGEAPFAVAVNPAEFHIQQGQPLDLSISVRRGADMPNEVQLNAAGMPLPPGLTAPIVKAAAGANEAKMQLNTDKLAPGVYSFILNGEGQVPYEEKPGANKKNIRCIYPTNPITVEVLAKEAAK